MARNAAATTTGATGPYVGRAPRVLRVQHNIRPHATQTVSGGQDRGVGPETMRAALELHQMIATAVLAYLRMQHLRLAALWQGLPRGAYG